jgi:outer membrane protein OmpA-like peptidoglycan-associated protein
MKMALKAIVVLALVAGFARAEDNTGRWGIGVDAGWGGRLGSKETRNDAGNGAAVGGSLVHGFAPHWNGALNYENIDLRGKRFEPITASAIYIFSPEKRWTPTAELGLGGARASRIPDSTGRETSLATKAGLGLDYTLCSAAVASVKATLYNAGRTSGAIGHEVDAAVFSAGLTWWFGGRGQAAPVAVAPAPKPTPAPAPTPKKVSIALDVQFETAKDVVRPQFDAKIKQAADFLKTHPKATAEIEGHTDNVGAEAYNTGLSQRRADSVRQYIVEHYGIDGARLTAKGYGPTMPIADNKTAEGRAQNRRVVATFDAVEYVQP